MRTGRFRVRRGLFNTCVLQVEHSHPTIIGGHVDTSLRTLEWVDVQYTKLDNIRFAQVQIQEETGFK